MAKTAATDVNADVNADVSSAPDDWTWNVIVEESPTKVIFDTIGDVFIGQYMGPRTITPENGRDEPFTVLTFRGRDGGLYAVNTSYKLNDALEDVDLGTWVKLEYVADIETNRNLNPMKDFRVYVKA